MKQVSTFLSICTLILWSCGTSPKEVNTSLVELQQQMKDGTIGNFDVAKQKLDSLRTECEKHISEIEFDTDQEKVKEKENYQIIVERINKAQEELVKEKEYFDNIFTGEKTNFQSLQAASSYFKMYPEGFFHRKAKVEFNKVFGDFVDNVSTNLLTLTKNLNEDNTEANLFQLISYTEEQTEQNERSNFNEEQINEALEHLHTLKYKLHDVLSAFPADFVSKKGNSISDMKQQFEDFENKAGALREAREAFIRSAIEKEIKNGYWELQAQREIEAHILQVRGGFFSSCDVAYLSNTIKKAEEDVITVTSTKATVKLHYNINSYCANNATSKYYDAAFTLVFPVIKRHFESGYFQDRTIRRTE